MPALLERVLQAGVGVGWGLLKVSYKVSLRMNTEWQLNMEQNYPKASGLRISSCSLSMTIDSRHKINWVVLIINKL